MKYYAVAGYLSENEYEIAVFKAGSTNSAEIMFFEHIAKEYELTEDEFEDERIYITSVVSSESEIKVERPR